GRRAAASPRRSGAEQGLVASLPFRPLTRAGTSQRDVPTHSKTLDPCRAIPERPGRAQPTHLDVRVEANGFAVAIARRNKTIGKDLDDAMIAIQRDNPSLKNTLPKDYTRPHLDKQSLGGVIDLISTIGLGDAESRAKDILGRVYEYFLSQFASAEGKKGGQFYTPRCVVQLLVEMLAPWKGRVFDPCCGSGGMFVQSVEFVNAHA